MPPIQQQQSSRAGLITALVFAIIFSLGFLVWAIMNNSELTKARQQLDAQKKKYDQVIADQSLSNIPELKVAFSPDVEKARTGTLIEAAQAQRGALVAMVTGNAQSTERDAAAAYQDAVKAIADAPALKGTQIPATSLNAAVKALVGKVNSDAAAVAAAKQDAQKSAQALEAEKQRHAQELAQRDTQVQQAQAAVTQAQANAQAAITEKQKQVDDFSTQVDEAKKALAEAQQSVQVQIQTLQRDVEQEKAEKEKALARLATFRPDVKNPAVRNVDATVTQLASDNTCYINLGFGDHLVPGMTFEVYDRLDGIPAIADGTSTEGMPKGKGSIEVIEVGQNSSRARILSQAPGQQIKQGDLCANLVYDKNVKPTFFVYGDFDMDQNGVASTPEAEVVKGLIQRWGGKVAEKLGVEVDYVIMGKEPTIPAFSKEEIEGDAVIRQRVAEAKAKEDAYAAIRDQAATMHIPLMNQNRFLYYSGYFDASKR